jgi:hypothetical protein
MQEAGRDNDQASQGDMGSVQVGNVGHSIVAFPPPPGSHDAPKSLIIACGNLSCYNRNGGSNHVCWMRIGKTTMTTHLNDGTITPQGLQTMPQCGIQHLTLELF